MVRLTAMRPFRPILRVSQQPSRMHLLHQRRNIQNSRQYQYADEKPQPFKNQLYESTQQRLRRERAEQERYAQYQTQSQGGRYAAMMFGTSAHV
jgi:D-lactate dehydrogenase (cytochrome)